MSKVNIIAIVDKDDDFSINEPYINYNLNDNKIFTYTFWKRKFTAFSSFFSYTGLDLFYISLIVFGVDRKFLRESTEDGWTRSFKVFIPVLEFDKWCENKTQLEELLNFLSGDLWEIEFRKRKLIDYEIDAREIINNTKFEKLNINKICMFSGGLDSFIGAIDVLEQGNISDVLFVSHYGGGKGVIEYQKVLRENLISEYNLNENHFYSFYASAKNGIEDTTRTRSFMFFAHAIVLASAMNKNVNLLIPENGLISLNIPLTNSRLGSSSTRTTHPYYMSMLQRLINNLKIDVTLKNPYQFLTKGEMIERCLNLNFLKDNIENTMSCSHPDQGRMNGDTVTSHCGYCLPCVIRRASILKAKIKDSSSYRDIDFTSGNTAKTNLMSYRIGLEKFNERTSFLKIQSSGPIVDRIEDYTGVYNRGMRELTLLLEKIDEAVLS
ncbi:MAG: 7-cyano-7-deazaguanine synthase [Bacillaceae bacterium]|nr:7-cyano-7-deazaguanine synthase [Bacillaceae bacterium]